MLTAAKKGRQKRVLHFRSNFLRSAFKGEVHINVLLLSLSALERWLGPQMSQ